MSALWPAVLLLIGVKGFLAQEIKPSDLADKEWWETALVYQIWPRGFQDSDGDGEGDLQGIISRLDYLQDLGIDTIWLNPIYASPLVDSGYDISNYTQINPIFGTLDQFDRLLDEAHNRDLKVILDIVPNHSSDQHDWFYLSAQNVEPYNDYYIWSNGTTDEYGNSTPPNNWASVYSDEEGSAWSWHDERQQWYYHKFHTTQPDLNLRNKDVVQELLDVFDFWLQRGVDGFRINAVPYFFEDEELQDEPNPENQTYTFGLPENAALLYIFRTYIDEWVEVNNATSKLLIAEAYDSDENLISFYGNGTYDGIPPFNYRFITHISNDSDAEYIRTVLEGWFDKLPSNATTNWVLSNHDYSRAASRIGLNRVDGLHMLTLLLPGQAYTYYGDEIAMLDTEILWEETIDPMGLSRSNDTYKEYSRDPSRTPMQWSSDVSAGFSSNENTYLPVHPDYVDRNVEDQLNQSLSNLNTYKKLSALRKSAIFTHGVYDIATLNDDRVLVLERSLEGYPVYIVVINLGMRPEKVNLTTLYPDLGDTLEIVVESSNAVNMTTTVPRDGFVLTANAALVLKGEMKWETTTEATSESTIIPTEEMEGSTGHRNVEPTTEGSKTESTTEDESLTVSGIVTTTTMEPVKPTEPMNSSVMQSGSLLQLIMYTAVSVIVFFRF